jgi:hypothetical protein
MGSSSNSLLTPFQRDTPATLAWLLSELRVPDRATLPAGITGEELREYITELVARLRRIAFPTKG